MLKNAFLQIFTWWNGATLSTNLFTRLRGERVGEDEQGNVYYQTAGGKKDKALGIVRRWVIYNGYADGSRVPPGWSGWLQHRTDIPPSKEDYKPMPWQLPHQPNMTGTAQAYRPSGSTLVAGDRQKSGGDYRPWTPGE